MAGTKRTAHIDTSLCVACGACVPVCPREALHIHNGMYSQVDETLCIGCGRCAKECPASIITVTSEGAA
ncbi:MAG: 4Fe-4S binding protein [Treponema sp.]|nr:4Fe-4S binding protein [Treponema sp.]